MNELEMEGKGAELLKVIRGSVSDARGTVQELAQILKDNVRILRVEESEGIFLQLLQNIKDLQSVMDFMAELRNGLRFFNEFGLPSDPIAHQETGLKLFREMNSAFETKDWIMLSDLIEYELSPLLISEYEWLGALDSKLSECAV